MQSVCLNEFGGEKVVPSNLQETTIIQHIFGGRLQSEVRHLIWFVVGKPAVLLLHFMNYNNI